MKSSEKNGLRKLKVNEEGRIGTCSCVTFKPKHYLKVLIFVHAHTSKADILHLEQRAMKCLTDI